MNKFTINIPRLNIGKLLILNLFLLNGYSLIFFFFVLFMFKIFVGKILRVFFSSHPWINHNATIYAIKREISLCDKW